jgi:hypothetical protein
VAAEELPHLLEYIPFTVLLAVWFTYDGWILFGCHYPSEWIGSDSIGTQKLSDLTPADFYPWDGQKGITMYLKRVDT